MMHIGRDRTRSSARYYNIFLILILWKFIYLAFDFPIRGHESPKVSTSLRMI